EAILKYRLRGIVLVVISLGLTSDAFLTTSNLLNVLRQASLVFLSASGLTLVIVGAGLDLSVGANLGLRAFVAAAAIKFSGALSAGVLVGLLCGTAVGLLNGLLVTKLRLPPFIATYGMLWMLYGVNYWYMKRDTIYVFPSQCRTIGSGELFGVPMPVCLMAVGLLAGGIFALSPTFGHEIYGIG